MTQYSVQDIWDSRALDTATTTSKGPDGEISKGRRYFKAKDILSRMLIYGNYGLQGNYGDPYLTKCAVYFWYKYDGFYAHFLMYTNGNIKYLSSSSSEIININVNKQDFMIGNVYDNTNLLIPCDSYGWVTKEELGKLNSESGSGNVTKDNYNHSTFQSLTFVPWSQNLESVIMKIPDDLPEPPIYSEQASNAEGYYQTRYDYSINGDIPNHNNYYYPKPSIPDIKNYESDVFHESYPYGAFKYSKYINDKTLKKEKFDIKWVSKSTNTLKYAGEQYTSANYINTFVIKVTGDLYINDSIWTGSSDDKNEILIPFHATGLLWQKEWQGMLQSNGGPNAEVFEALTGVPLSSYWTPTPGKDQPVTTCKTQEKVFQDRISTNAPIYLFNGVTFIGPQTNLSNLKYDQPLFFKMSDIFSKLLVYNCVYYLDSSTIGIKRFIKIETNGDVSKYDSSQSYSPIDYPNLIYSKVGNIFDDTGNWSLSKVYVALQFYGALFQSEQDYYKQNPGCGTIFTRLTYEDIVNIDKYKKIVNSGSGIGTTTPTDDNPPPIYDDDDDSNPPPIDTGDSDEIPSVTNTGTDGTSTDGTGTDVTTGGMDGTTSITSTGIVDLGKEIISEIKDELNNNKSTEIETNNNMDNATPIDISGRIFIGLAILFTIGIIAYATTSTASGKKHKKHKHRQVE